MEEYKRAHVPAFGSWDWNDSVPFTECFESATQAAGFLRCSYSGDRDLYVTGDLYQNDVVTPAMIVVPRTMAKVREQNSKKVKHSSWVSDVKEPPSPFPSLRRRPVTPKPVDEDLYKISPDLLFSAQKKKRGLGFFSSCLSPTCMT